jgi:hypothetical protein
LIVTVCEVPEKKGKNKMRGERSWKLWKQATGKEGKRRQRVKVMRQKGNKGKTEAMRQ